MIKSLFFNQLKRLNITDTRMVDRLFVSVFMRYHKLTPYNNTLLKSYYISAEDNENTILETLIALVEQSNCKCTIEDLVNLFEFVISPSDRIVTGAIYTPQYIRKCILDNCLSGITMRELSNYKFADIACGCGSFLIDVAVMLHERVGKRFHEIYNNNIFGIDIQSYSITRTKLLLSLVALKNGEDADFCFNLWQADTLEFDFNLIGPIDIIVGNPPYVCARNMEEKSKILMKRWSVCKSGNPDLYIPFFQIATENLRIGGRIGLITMNSFLTSLNGRALREYFSYLQYDIRIVDFRGKQLFKGRSTYTCLFFLRKEPSNHIKYCINEKGLLCGSFNYQSICYAKTNSHQGWLLNDFEETLHYETIGIPLGKYCSTRHGIATLCNKVYILSPAQETNKHYIIKKEGKQYLIEKEICRSIINSNKLNSDVRFTDIIEKVIFPYEFDESGHITIIAEQKMQKQFPFAYNYLLDCKEMLQKRDKGKTSKYPIWYAYGRTQSLVMPRYKLFFPKLANKSLQCTLCCDKDLLLYNGISFVSNDEIALRIIKCILESDIFWNYVRKNSKPYASGYFSLNGINIKNFGIPIFTQEEKDELLSLSQKEQINQWLEKYYV